MSAYFLRNAAHDLGEPIVGSVEDAFRCFMGSEIDVLVIGNCFLRKECQDPSLKLSYKDNFDLD